MNKFQKMVIMWEYMFSVGSIDNRFIKFRNVFKGFYILNILFFLFTSCSLVQAQSTVYETPGIRSDLPVFYKKMAARQDYSLSWTHGGQGDFDSWRQKARSQIMECLLPPPPFVPFDAVVIAEQDRGTYVARKIVFNVTGDSRVLAYLLVPKSIGPHPAVLLLHDHGAKYDIGKEKVIEPFGVSTTILNSAKDWVKIYYGNRFIGDELAKQGYVCLAVDMFNWGSRGGASSSAALAANFFILGASYSGLIAHEDMRAAEFLSKQPEVDSTRIAAMGLSVGGYRTWQLAALSDHIAAGVSVCWMSTYKSLVVPGGNFTTGAYTMLHPGLSNFLDFPDVASVACPKPMMFCNGNVDGLFPVASIKEAHAKMHEVWDSQNVGDKLVTKLYDAPHQFNLQMQNDAFPWLDSVLKNTPTQVNIQSINSVENISLFVFPNPAGNEVTISYQLLEDSAVKGVLVDSSGKETILFIDEKQNLGKHSCIINTSNLENAAYFVKMKVNKEQISKKIIVFNP
jgi:dienelactone hydrolase